VINTFFPADWCSYACMDYSFSQKLKFIVRIPFAITAYGKHFIVWTLTFRWYLTREVNLYIHGNCQERNQPKSLIDADSLNSWLTSDFIDLVYLIRIYSHCPMISPFIIK
jgi:hypothetical protein